MWVIYAHEGNNLYKMARTYLSFFKRSQPSECVCFVKRVQRQLKIWPHASFLLLVCSTPFVNLTQLVRAKSGSVAPFFGRKIGAWPSDPTFAWWHATSFFNFLCICMNIVAHGQHNAYYYYSYITIIVNTTRIISSILVLPCSSPVVDTTGFSGR